MIAISQRIGFIPYQRRGSRQGLDDPIRGGAVLTAINCAVNGLVPAVAGELVTQGVRTSVVSPGMVEDSVAEPGPFFSGHTPAAMPRVIDAYVKSGEGLRTDEVIKVY